MHEVGAAEEGWKRQSGNAETRPRARENRTRCLVRCLALSLSLSLERPPPFTATAVVVVVVILLLVVVVIIVVIVSPILSRMPHERPNFRSPARPRRPAKYQTALSRYHLPLCISLSPASLRRCYLSPFAKELFMERRPPLPDAPVITRAEKSRAGGRRTNEKSVSAGMYINAHTHTHTHTYRASANCRNFSVDRSARFRPYYRP